MAKDFDFIPAKPLRKRPGRTTPAARPTPKPTVQPKKRTVSPKPARPSVAAPTEKRMHQTRSSLIDYHPLEVPSKVKKPTSLKPAVAGHSSASSTTTTYAAPPYLPPARHVPTAESKPKKRLNKKTVISAVVGFVVIVLLASGMLIPLLENPSVTIIIYVVAAIIFRLNSRVSFSIALLLLLAIPVLLLIRNGALASTYAIFCFYFLVVGVISATIELLRTDR